MKKIVALLLLLAGILAVGAAAGEGPESPGTPTDLCPHEHTQPVYYFDHPEYISVNDYSHLIRGSAIVNTVCQDCGEVIRSEQQADAEEVRVHIFKKGKCVLCGQPEPQPLPPEPEELSVVTVAGDDSDPPAENGQMEIRLGGGSATLILPAGTVKAETERTGAKLSAEIREEEDRIYAALRMGESSFPADGVTLRIYGRKIATVIFSGTDEKRTQTQTAEWTAPDGNREGYSSVPWLGNGYYKFIEE